MKYTALENLRKKYKYYSKYLWALIILAFGSGICGVGALYNLHKVNLSLNNYGDTGRDNVEIVKSIEKNIKYASRFLKVGKFLFAIRLFFTGIFIIGFVMSFNQVMNASLAIH